MERYKHLKETLMCAIEGQALDLQNANTKELGEAIDMVKDLEEAMYYAAITKAMKADEKEWEEEGKYYHPIHDYGTDRMYYDDKRSFTEYGSNLGGNPSSRSTMTSNDMREGRSGQYRRSYMEGKEIHKDKQNQMREIEKYMQELSSDIIEMIDHSSPEERQYLEKKLAALSKKIGQLND